MKVTNPKAYELRALGGEELGAGAPAALRVFVNNADIDDPSPIRGAPVTIGMQDEQGYKKMEA